MAIQIKSPDIGFSNENLDLTLTIVVKLVFSTGSLDTYDGDIYFEMSNSDKIHYFYKIDPSGQDEKNDKNVIEITGCKGKRVFDIKDVTYGSIPEIIRECYVKYLYEI